MCLCVCPTQVSWVGGRADVAMHDLHLCEFPLSAEELTSRRFYDRLGGSVTAGKRVSICDGQTQGSLPEVSASPDQNIPNETQGEERYGSVASVAFPFCSPTRLPMFKHSLLRLAFIPHQGLMSNC